MIVFSLHSIHALPLDATADQTLLIYYYYYFLVLLILFISFFGLSVALLSSCVSGTCVHVARGNRKLQFRNCALVYIASSAVACTFPFLNSFLTKTTTTRIWRHDSSTSCVHKLLRGTHYGKLFRVILRSPLFLLTFRVFRPSFNAKQWRQKCRFSAKFRGTLNKKNILSTATDRNIIV